MIMVMGTTMTSLLGLTQLADHNILFVKALAEMKLVTGDVAIDR
jgi:hypothetical protein